MCLSITCTGPGKFTHASGILYGSYNHERVQGGALAGQTQFRPFCPPALGSQSLAPPVRLVTLILDILNLLK